MLCVSGDVAFTCMTVTKPMANPMQPVIVILDQKSMENNLSTLLNNISDSNRMINGKNKNEALKLL